MDALSKDGRRCENSGLEGHPPERAPLNLEDKAASLSPFQLAALLLYRSHLQQIDKLTSAVFATVADIQNFTPAKFQKPSLTGLHPQHSE